jgi:ribokinase
VPAVTSPRVLVVGSANVDYTVAVARLPAPGETVSEGVLLVNHGGKGANQAVAARRLGADVRLIACVGADAGGRAIQAALAGEGIDAARVHAKDDVATGTALIVVDATGRNQIAVAPGANRALRIEQLRAHRDAFGWAQVVLCQLETPLDIVAAALEEARRCGAVTILNPAPVPTAPLGVWPLVDYLTPNRGEAERLSGVRGTDAEGVVTGAGRLRAKGVGTVVVTLGEDGALACDSQGTMNVPGFLRVRGGYHGGRRRLQRCSRGGTGRGPHARRGRALCQRRGRTRVHSPWGPGILADPNRRRAAAQRRFRVVRRIGPWSLPPPSSRPHKLVGSLTRH